MRTPMMGLWLAPCLALWLLPGAAGCSKDCDKLHTRLTACGYGPTMPDRVKFISQCRSDKSRFKVMLRCVDKRDCKDFRECVEAASEPFSTDKREPVTQVAKRLQVSLQKKDWERTLRICLSKREDYSRAMRDRCDLALAKYLVRELQTARRDGAFAPLQDLCWRGRSILGKRTAAQCKRLRTLRYDYLRGQALRIRDQGPYDSLAARCKTLKEAGDKLSKAHGVAALALCDDLNAAEPAAKAVAVVQKRLTLAKRGLAELKSGPHRKVKTTGKTAPGADAAPPPEDPIKLPYQCGSEVKSLEKYGSVFALRRRDALVRLCHQELGAVILARDLAQKDCSYHGSKVLAAILKYKLVSPALVRLAPQVTKLCEQKAAKEAREAKRR